MRSDAEAIDLVALLVQAQYRVLVDVVRCHDRQLAEPRQLEPFRDALERFARQAAQVRQIAGIDANADRTVALIVQPQRYGTEVQQTAPVARTCGCCLFVRQSRNEKKE